MIKKKDINKKIYFINDKDNDLKELNEFNTKLYVNDKKEEFKTYIKIWKRWYK